MPVFLSYGHDQYVSLAERIKHDPEAQGNEVWFDVERLKTGGDWERYIEEGLDRASSDLNTGRFLLLMTPHSVRRPNGYCLNELARALSRNLPVNRSRWRCYCFLTTSASFGNALKRLFLRMWARLSFPPLTQNP